MADEHAPGWWQASDGRWYPPDLHPDAAAAAPPGPSLDKPAAGGFAAPGTGEPPAAGAPMVAPSPYGAPPAQGAVPPYGGPPPYGAPAPYGGYGGPMGPTGPKTAGMAVAAIVLGGGSLLVSFVPVLGFASIPFALVGIGIGIAALSQVKKGGLKGKGLAIGGIVTAVLALIVSAMWALVWNAASDNINDVNFDTIDGINSDPSDGECDVDRFMQDPDC